MIAVYLDKFNSNTEMCNMPRYDYSQLNYSRFYFCQK